MRTNLEAEGISVTPLRWVFAAGAISSLGIIWMAVELLIGPPYSFLKLLVLSAPWLAVYYLLGGDLALKKIPIRDWMKGVATLVAAIILATMWFAARSHFFDAAALFAILIGGSHVIAYTLAFLDRDFSRAAEVIRTIQTKLDQEKRSRGFRDCYDTILYIGTFDAVLRHADTAEDAIRTQLARMPYLNQSGLQDARRYFEMKAGAST
ncbi:hypothetical protein C8N43_1845 [Litoreibacter ponti]|uniref:Uncharacterized protein n=2 Tax=Litoreibacter ponti TaxID=1510457 RepID=A0A2T6BM91_9RHOB|nr:hypothetical protein C8N43_1845 [Litoreibacter ponti]